MRLQLPKSLRARLMLATAAAFIPLVGAFLYTQSELRGSVEADWENRTIVAADGLMGAYERTLARFGRVIEGLATRPEFQDPGPGVCDAVLGSVQAGFAEAAKLAVVGLDGIPICVTPDDGLSYDISDRPYFQRAVATGELTLSEFFYGSTSKLSLVTAAQALRRADGSMTGVLVMGVDVEELTRSHADPKLPLVVFDRDGRVLARQGGPVAAPAVNEQVEPLLSDAAGSGASVAHIASADESAAIHYHVRPLRLPGMPEETSATLAVGYDMALATSQTARASTINLIGIALAAVGVLLAMWIVTEFLFLRRLRVVMRASNNLGNGDLTARTHLAHESDEVGRLASTFDKMADRLQEAREREQHEKDREIAELDQRLRQIAQHIDAAIWMWDPQERRFLYLSPAFETIWGVGVDEVMARPELLFEGVHEDDREAVRLRSERGQLEEGEHQYRVVRPNGEVRWVLHRTIAIQGESGRAERFLGTVVDITERQHLEESLQRSQRLEAVGLLAGGIAHDFNNVLTAIRGHTNLILEDLPDDIALTEDVRGIDKAAQRASDLTRQLLAFSRKQNHRPGVLDANDLIEGLMSMVGRLVDGKIEVGCDLQDGLPSIVADKGHLEQAVINLVVNAQDAMPSGGRLTVRTRMATTASLDRKRRIMPAPEYVVIEVIDSGVGMPEHVLKHAFEPFYTTKEPGKGTGLGLASTYGTVKQAGGYAWIDSEPGHGTTVGLYFPPAVEVEEAAVEEPAADLSIQAGTGRILLVEDEDAVRAVAKRALSRAGYEVHEAMDGQAAYEMFVENPDGFDLLLTDVVMPRVTGPELYQMVKPVRDDLPVVFMSGYPGRGLGSEMLSDSDAPFLQKPFSSATLAEAVRTELTVVRGGAS